jgi:hypothetical protein
MPKETVDTRKQLHELVDRMCDAAMDGATLHVTMSYKDSEICEAIVVSIASCPDLAASPLHKAYDEATEKTLLDLGIFQEGKYGSSSNM